MWISREDCKGRAFNNFNYKEFEYFFGCRKLHKLSRQARILMREANTYQQLKYGSFIDKISYQLYRKIIPWAYGYAIRVVANSRDTLQDIIDLGPKPTTTEFITIGNPVIANPSKPQLLSRGPRIGVGQTDSQNRECRRDSIHRKILFSLLRALNYL